MAISLYDLTVPSYLQTVNAISGVLGRGLAFCKEKGVDPQTFVETRLFPDMLPLAFQVASVSHHSAGALASLKSGVFNPPSGAPLADYAALQAKIDATKAELEALTPDAVNALSGGDVRFEMGDLKMPFTAENFILSFSLPNFHFHATTTYDILRSQGVPLGKRHYMGQLRMKA
jgi:hypothetical protein